MAARAQLPNLAGEHIKKRLRARGRARTAQRHGATTRPSTRFDEEERPRRSRAPTWEAFLEQTAPSVKALPHHKDDFVGPGYACHSSLPYALYLDQLAQRETDAPSARECRGWRRAATGGTTCSTRLGGRVRPR